MKVLKAKTSNCELCGVYEDLRPYGPNGEWICFPCGMKDEETTRKQLIKLLTENNILVIDTRPEIEN